MSWAADDDAQFRATVEAAGGQERLAELVCALLMHEFKVEIVRGEPESYGIALLLDGWYTDRRNAAGLDAESVLPYWQEIVDHIRALATEENGQ
jgi:hypothetical protein